MRKSNIGKSSGERTLKDTLGANIKYQREKMKLTQAQLAKLCGVKQNTISSVEKGRSWPSAELLSDLSKHLNVSAALLMS